jgi:hypothetical protein
MPSAHQVLRGDGVMLLAGRHIARNQPREMLVTITLCCRREFIGDSDNVAFERKVAVDP